MDADVLFLSFDLIAFGNAVADKPIENVANGTLSRLMSVEAIEKSVSNGALSLEKGKFYTWNKTAKDYVQATANGLTGVDTLTKYTIDYVNVDREDRKSVV